MNTPSPQHPQQPPQFPPPPQQSTPPGVVQPQQAITNPGEFYGAGWGMGFYGVWDMKTGILLQRFEPTQQGWDQAVALRNSLDRRRQWERIQNPLSVWVLLNLVLAAIIFPILEIILLAILLGVTGHDVEKHLDGSGTGVAVWLSSIVGWLLLVYVRPKPYRVWLGAIVMVAGFLWAAAIAFTAHPWLPR